MPSPSVVDTTVSCMPPAAHGGVALGPWFKQVRTPYPLNHDVSVATSGLFLWS